VQDTALAEEVLQITSSLTIFESAVGNELLAILNTIPISEQGNAIDLVVKLLVKVYTKRVNPYGRKANPYTRKNRPYSIIE